jgi:hypothetical protein
MTHFLPTLALTRTGIDMITPSSSSYLYCAFPMLTLWLVMPYSPSSLPLTAYILPIQLTRIAEREILPAIVPNQLLTLLQNSEATEYSKSMVSIQLVYCIRRFIFIYYQYHTQSQPM